MATRALRPQVDKQAGTRPRGLIKARRRGSPRGAPRPAPGSKLRLCGRRSFHRLLHVSQRPTHLLSVAAASLQQQRSPSSPLSPPLPLPRGSRLLSRPRLGGFCRFDTRKGCWERGGGGRRSLIRLSGELGDLITRSGARSRLLCRRAA